MGRSGRRRGNRGRKASRLPPPPTIGDAIEFPPLNQSMSPHGSSGYSSPPDAADCVGVETGVCVDGTTYFVNAITSLNSSYASADGIGTGCPAAQPQDLAKKQGARQFPGDAFFAGCDDDAAAGGSAELFLKDRLRQAILAQVEKYLASYFVPFDGEVPWKVLDDFILVELLDQQIGLIDGKPNSVYLARHSRSGEFMVVRRLHDVALRNQRALDILEKWNAVGHPNVVRLRSITTTRQLGDASVLFAYDFHPNALTLEQFFHESIASSNAAAGHHHLLDEQVVWSFCVQLVGALRALHANGLAARVLSPRSILVTATDRCTVRINCGAVADVLDVSEVANSVFLRCYHGEYRATAEAQQLDLVHLGEVLAFMRDRLPFGLIRQPGSSRPRTSSNVQMKELADLADALRTGELSSIDDVVSCLGPLRILDQLCQVQAHKDVFERELFKEIDNGRLVRLMVMVAQILKDCEMSSESAADCYDNEPAHLVHLFGDFLFSRRSIHHVIAVLNKLDAGVPEMIRLSGATSKHGSLRDSLYTVSYAELRDIFYQRHAFDHATTPSPNTSTALQPVSLPPPAPEDLGGGGGPQDIGASFTAAHQDNSYRLDAPSAARRGSFATDFLPPPPPPPPPTLCNTPTSLGSSADLLTMSGMAASAAPLFTLPAAFAPTNVKAAAAVATADYHTGFPGLPASCGAGIYGDQAAASADFDGGLDVRHPFGC